MSLVNCKECGKEVSDQAASCPHCGAPIQGSPTNKATAKSDGRNGYLLAFGIFIGLITVSGVISSINGFKIMPVVLKQVVILGNRAGMQLVYGRSGCRRTLQELLRDPESLQGDEYTVAWTSQEKWTAKIQFRSRNGFGGMSSGEAVCSFDGSNYEAFLTSP